MDYSKNYNKKTGPAEGILGETIDFNLEISNPGDTDAQGVVVKDIIPEGLSYLQSDVPPAEVTDQEITWNIGVLAKDEVRTMTVTFKATKVGTWTNTAQITSSDIQEPQTSTSEIKIGEPEIYVLKEGPKQMRKEQEGNFKLTVKNTGNAVARDVVIHDRIPPGMAYKGQSEGLVLEWKLGDLQPNETREVGYILVATRPGEFINTAKAAVKGKVVHQTEMKTLVVAPELSIEKTGPRLMFLYRGADYKITITNSGNGPAFDVLVTDTIPNGFDYVSSEPRGTLRPEQEGSNAEVSWNFPEIAAQSKVELTINLRAKEIGTFRNSVKLISNSSLPPRVDPLEASADTNVIGIPAMHISTYDTEDPCEVGQQTIYVIEARNEGTSPCTNVVMENKIPDEMEFVSASGPVDYNFDEATRTVVFVPAALLAPGEKLVYKVVCKAITEGSAKNTAKMSYDQFDKPILDEEGTSVYK